MRGIALALVAIAGGGAAQAQAPTFLARTDLVRLDVLVERNGHPVAGLTAEDFVVEDAGVRQRVVLLPATDAVAVATVLDVSGSISREQLGHAAAALRTLAGGLRAGDQHEVYAFAGAVHVVPVAATAETSVDDLARALRAGGGPHTALFDALQVAIVRPARIDAPKLTLVVTDGHDNTSWLDAETIVDAAVRHETPLHVVAIRQSTPGPADVPPIARDAALRLLHVIADRTGGRVIDAGWSAGLGAQLAALLHDYRQRYILGFAPDGVPRGDGWHPLQVSLRHGRGTVHARAGYWSR
jgi:VWFA-related protein